MAMFDFLKKKEPQQEAQQQAFPSPPQQGGTTPVQFVQSLKQQGLTNNQIVQTLQRQGYSQTQIYDAMSQAESHAAMQMHPGQLEQPPMEQPPMQEAPQQYDQQEHHQPQQSEHHFEELAEKIVEEKWHAFLKERKSDNEWREETSERVAKLEQSLTDLKTEVQTLHRAIVSKIGDYDKSLLSVGTEIKAMEKVFQQILPSLSENVQELSKVTKDLKGKKVSKK